ncbi:MAG: hypothetical protein IBJ10_00195 [Phycisphaerales bacterium]|nr:hypothetical protein [Phycisphaerales bacterium]
MPMRPAFPTRAGAQKFSVGALAALLVAAGCSIPPEEQGFSSPSPGARARAVGVAVAADDREAIPDLINMLGSDDPGHRMLAIRALHRMTGQTLGYAHDAPEADRERAIGAWVAWWQAGAPDGPSTGSSVVRTGGMADHEGAGARAERSAAPPAADQER